MEKKQFDLNVHHRDPKSGRIMKEDNYILHCHKEHGQVFERDGNFYDYQGDEADGSKFIVNTKKVVLQPKVEAKTEAKEEPTVLKQQTKI